MTMNGKKPDYNDNFERSNNRDIYSYSKSRGKTRIQLGAKTLRNRKIILSFAIVLSVILGLLGGVLLYAYKMLDSLNYQAFTSDEAEYIAGSAQDPMILNVALFGVDKHDEADSRSRSDSLMVLSLDSRRKKIKLTSIMRDLWVQIPGYRDNRINTAIALGGEQLAIQTIEQNFGIKIDRYCTVDFEGFRDIIDIIGGLDIELTKQEAHHINRLLIELDAAFKEGGIQPFNSPQLKETDGVQHLNGAQALQYARSRKVPTADGDHDDYARTFRQRKVISLVIEKLKSTSLPQLLSVVEKAGPYINTNLKKNEIITLSKNSPKYLKYEVTEYRLPEDGNYEGRNINGAAILVLKDLNKARYDLAKFIYEDSVKENLSEAGYSSKSTGSSTQVSRTTKEQETKENKTQSKPNEVTTKTQSAKTSESNNKGAETLTKQKQTKEQTKKSADSSNKRTTSVETKKATNEQQNKSVKAGTSTDAKKELTTTEHAAKTNVGQSTKQEVPAKKASQNAQSNVNSKTQGSSATSSQPKTSVKKP